MPGERPKYYDVEYGLSSAAVTTGLTAIATTEANYHGLAMVAGTTQVSVTIYDSASATSGNVVDKLIIKANGSVWIDRYIPVKAKYGLTTAITGSGASGTVFYGPKG